jgi:hypothetical protein
MTESIFTYILIIFSPLILMAWINFFYLILNRKKEPNQQLSLIAILSLYLLSLAPIGLFVGIHLNSRKIKDLNEYKYSEAVRSNGNLIFIISIASTLISISIWIK